MKTQYQVALDQARSSAKDIVGQMKVLRMALRSKRERIAELRATVKDEKRMAKIVREDARKLRELKRAEKAAEREARTQRRIAKAQERLNAMIAKANAPKKVRRASRKASDVVVYTAEQIAELNAKREVA